MTVIASRARREEISKLPVDGLPRRSIRPTLRTSDPTGLKAVAPL
jgi:hypothetical protein